ncbi:MAG TPA: glycosyltransferase [Thermoleophilia bacterium]|nr:glycosyltransferase [Thermoleophilia bacterium]
MATPPGVTIVIATHNRAGFLADAIDSVLRQDYPDLECVVVDDGSTDATPEVLARYEGRITVVTQENQGQPAAVNRGFAAAGGELLGVLGDDDRLFSGALAAMAGALEAAPAAVAAHGDVLVVDDQERPLRIHSAGSFQLLECLRHHVNPSSTGVLYRRWAMEAIGGWDPEFPYGPDAEVWWRLGLKGPYVYVPRTLGTYRMHAGSISGMRERDEARAAEYVRSAQRFLERNDLPPEIDKAMRDEVMRCAYYCAAVVVGGELNQEGERFNLNDDWVARFTTKPGVYPDGEAPGAVEAQSAAAPPEPARSVEGRAAAPHELTRPAGSSAGAAVRAVDRPDLPLLSVVTPCYNGTRYLVETIESVLAQDYPRLEHIIIDDGSTDATGAIIDTYAARYPGRIRAYHHENVGQAASINRGFDLAEGEFLAVVNSDDPMLPGLFSAVAGRLACEPDLVGVYPDFLVIDEDGATLTEIHPPDFSLAEMVRLGDNYLGPGVVFRKSLVGAIGGWSADYPMALDLDFWLRGALVGGYGHVPEVLATWRSHDAAKTVRDRTTDESLEERFRLLDAFFARPDVPDDVRAVRQEAYKNLHIITAIMLTTQMNGPTERFVIHDRHARRLTRAPSIEAEIATHADVFEQRARDAEARLAVVAASTSWRLTRPLRAIGRAYRARRSRS